MGSKAFVQTSVNNRINELYICRSRKTPLSLQVCVSMHLIENHTCMKRSPDASTREFNSTKTHNRYVIQSDTHWCRFWIVNFKMTPTTTTLLIQLDLLIATFNTFNRLFEKYIKDIRIHDTKEKMKSFQRNSTETFYSLIQPTYN